MPLTKSYSTHHVVCNIDKPMQRMNETYNINGNILNNSILIRIMELSNKGIREVTNGIGIMSQQEWADVHEKDLIHYTHRFGGNL